MTSLPTALVVEDEADIRELIALHLRREKYNVTVSGTGDDAQRLIQSQKYDLFVLDWMLPGFSGVELVRTIRKQSPSKNSSVLMVTAKSEPVDIVFGLEQGADDYITKPFDIKVFTARVRAIRRRLDAQDERIELPGLIIEPARYRVLCEGVETTLTPSEFKLLLALVRNRGRVLTRDRLIELVQGEGVAVVDRAIDTHVFGLRKKLGACADLIETIRGIGYRVKDELT